MRQLLAHRLRWLSVRVSHCAKWLAHRAARLDPAGLAPRTAAESLRHEAAHWQYEAREHLRKFEECQRHAQRCEREAAERNDNGH